MADRPIERIDTDIDSFYSLLVQKGQIKLDEACNALNLEKKHILKYVTVLERAKKLTAKYPLIGQPVFSLPADQSPNPSERSVTPGTVKASFEIPKSDEQSKDRKETKGTEITEEKKGSVEETKSDDFDKSKKSEEKDIASKAKEKIKEEVPKKKGICPDCGNPLKEGAKFCTRCGSGVKK